MARVEKSAGIEQRIADMKGEMVDEVKRHTRRSRPWLTCSLIILVVLVGVCVWGLWSVAATGLMRVPIFTDLAYEIPEPTRPVTPGVPVETVTEEVFTSTLTRRLYEGGGTLSNRSISMEIEETSITASLRSFLEKNNLDWIDTAGTQVVVDPEVGVELFVPFLGSELSTAAILTFDVGTQEGNLFVTPTKFQIGSAKIPYRVVALFLKPFLEAELAKFNSVMLGYAKISTIEILARVISVNGELSVEVEKDL